MAESRSHRFNASIDEGAGTPLLKMVWRHRLFLHWPVEARMLRQLVPSQLEIDTTQGSAWLGITASRLANMRPILTPPMPGLSTFSEVNLRTCVVHRGERGVFFFSLDASSSVAVWTARTFLHLPYFRARIQTGRRGETFRFTSRREHQGAQPGEFDCAWTIGKSLPRTQPGDLAHFLTERHQTFTVHRGRVYSCRVEHDAWPLREARLTKFQTTLFTAAGVSAPERSPLVLHGDELAVEMCSMKEAVPAVAESVLLDPVVAPPPASLRG